MKPIIAKTNMQIDLGTAGEFDRERFRQVFGGVYEHSPWLADVVFDASGDSSAQGKPALKKSALKKPVLKKSVLKKSALEKSALEKSALGKSALGKEALIQRFEQAFLNSSKAQQLEVLQAHPELACQLSSKQQLTAASQQEQSGSGLDQCSDSELMQFIEYNHKYMNKNNFPFIIAVKGLNRSDILERFEKRLGNDTDAEFEAALLQVNRIARLRIEAILGD